jgi:hypothetical protein
VGKLSAKNNRRMIAHPAIDFGVMSLSKSGLLPSQACCCFQLRISSVRPRPLPDVLRDHHLAMDSLECLTG